MPTAVTERPYRPVPTEPTRKRWTRAEFAILESLEPWDQQRLELVDGELINKMGKNRPHVIVLAAIRDWLILVFGGVYINTEAPIDVGPEDNPTTEPQPDLIVLAKPSWQIPEANPQPGDLRLVVEISDSTLGFDLTTKAALYARAGILDYWVLDIPARRLIVHRDPVSTNRLRPTKRKRPWCHWRRPIRNSEWQKLFQAEAHRRNRALFYLV